MLETNDPSIALMEEEVTQGVDYLVSKLLNDREQKVIALSFGLRDEEPRSLEAIGELLGVSRTRIGQIQKKALRKLGAPFNRDLFEPFMKPNILPHLQSVIKRNLSVKQKRTNASFKG
jgi:DNA-directed RNA polymerase sigma subunit (sigma70/sigma32)